MKENPVGSTETTEQGANQQLPLPGVKLGICNMCLQVKKTLSLSKPNVRSEFCHCSLNDKTKDLNAFGTPYGNYRYKWLPMSITSQQSIPGENDQVISRGECEWCQHHSSWLSDRRIWK